MWWALFVRTGVPPRVAKRRLTVREAREFFAYCEAFPIDDQSNHHMPIAFLHSTVRNMMGGKATIRDCMLFADKQEGQDVESQLLGGNW